MSKHYIVHVPATSANMGPGFDCFGLALKFHNTFVFRSLDNQDNELIFNADFPLRQNPRTNLIYKAYVHTLKELGVQNIPGIEINVLSKIPSARGLGSSASAVVAGVLVAGAISNTNLKLSEVIKLSTDIEGHPDNVAPAILGGMAISVQEKSFIYTESINFPADELEVLVAIPDIRVHTANSRRVLPKKVSFEDAVFNLRRSALYIASLYNKDWNALRIAMNDKLHQQQRSTLIPGLMRVMHTAKKHGALGATLSGSGPSVLILVHKSKAHQIETISNSIKKVWESMDITSTVMHLPIQEKVTRIRTISEEKYNRIITPNYRATNNNTNISHLSIQSPEKQEEIISNQPVNNETKLETDSTNTNNIKKEYRYKQSRRNRKKRKSKH